MSKSLLHILNTVTGEQKVIKEFSANAEAPNWSPDGSYLLFNSEGKLYRLFLANAEVAQVPLDEDLRANNDHCISRDGTFYAVSASSKALGGGSRVWILPADSADGKPRLVTEQAPSYLHGISPDGKTLAYCANRNDNYDVYTIPTAGGAEQRLTTAEGLDDGPEYAPSGEIWFNSVRTGNMQVYRMNADGSAQTQMTFDTCRNWFPHVSPSGEKVVFLSYRPEEVEAGKHPANKNITLSVMKADGTDRKILYQTDAARNEYGGQGTINVNSWSPDSVSIAFFTYIVE